MLRQLRIGHLGLFGAEGAGNLFQIQLGGDRRDRHRQVFGVAVQRHQQGFVNPIGIQPQLSHRLVAEISFVAVVVIRMEGEGDLLFFKQNDCGRHDVLSKMSPAGKG
jgi:hypothetical protein